MIENHTRQRYPTWLPKVLLSTTAGLFAVAAVLSVATYKLTTRRVELQDLSATQRQHLIQEANKIVPPIFQPFPLAGPPLFYLMTPFTRYENALDTFTTNELGFRAVATSPKPNDVKRIVVVGDSWTFGQSVKQVDTFTYQLDQLLNRKGHRWQVYNFGIPGWNTANEIAALRTYFSRVRPDIVVFCPTSNDIDDGYGIWNGRLINRGFNSGAMFRRSYAFESRWIRVFKSLQAEVDALKGLGVPSLIYFLAEWRKLTPYYAKLSDFRAPYVVVPSRYLEAKYRLTPDVDPGRHPSPKGHRSIGIYLHNALLEAGLVNGLDRLPIGDRVVFPGQVFDSAEVAAEFKAWERLANQVELMPLNDGFMSWEGMFSVTAPPNARTVRVHLKLIDDPGLYPLAIEVRLESPENISLTKVFDRFVPGVQTIEITKPSSLDTYPVIEVHVIADRVVVPKDLTPISMFRPTLDVR